MTHYPPKPDPTTFNLSSALTSDLALNKSHFLRNPRVAPLLSHPSYTPIPTSVRVPKPSGEDSFFGGTLNTPSTVRNLLCLRRNGLDLSTALLPSPPSQSHTPSPPPTQPSPTPNLSKPTRLPDIVYLMRLALPGLQGHPATAHGGLLTCLFDEMMGQTLIAQFPLTTSTPNTGVIKAHVPGSTYTANLSVDFKRPVPLPGTYLYRGWMIGQSGRKSWVYGEIMDADLNGESDGEDDVVQESGKEGENSCCNSNGTEQESTSRILTAGKVLASGTSLWIFVPLEREMPGRHNSNDKKKAKI